MKSKSSVQTYDIELFVRFILGFMNHFFPFTQDFRGYRDTNCVCLSLYLERKRENLISHVFLE